jgi:hypothetical protein
MKFTICAFSFAVLTTASVAGENCASAENRSYQLRSWSAAYAYYRDYSGWCIDGALGEGLSESITLLLDRPWSDFRRYQALAKRDPGFEKWVIGRFNGSPDDECSIVRTEHRLTRQCPVESLAFCKPLAAQAQRVVEFEPELKSLCEGRK